LVQLALSKNHRVISGAFFGHAHGHHGRCCACSALFRIGEHFERSDYLLACKLGHLQSASDQPESASTVRWGVVSASGVDRSRADNYCA
jgi:hypothetical protein